MYDDKILRVTGLFALHGRTPAKSCENYVTTENGLKMASTAAYNLWDNHRYSIANFNFN